MRAVLRTLPSHPEDGCNSPAARLSLMSLGAPSRQTLPLLSLGDPPPVRSLLRLRRMLEVKYCSLAMMTLRSVSRIRLSRHRGRVVASPVRRLARLHFMLVISMPVEGRAILQLFLLQVTSGFHTVLDKFGRQLCMCGLIQWRQDKPLRRPALPLNNFRPKCASGPSSNTHKWTQQTRIWRIFLRYGCER